MSEFYTFFELSQGKIHVRGYRDGKRFAEQFPHKPWCYIPSKNPNYSQYKTLDGVGVDRLDFGDTFEERDFLERYKEVDNFKIYGLTGMRHKYAYINERYPTIDYDRSLVRVINIDIETISDEGFPQPETADKAIVAITAICGDVTVALGIGKYEVHEPGIKYIFCEDEKTLLHKFLQIWKNYDPDVVTGWNIGLFDIPYIYNRITKVLGKKEADSLSPYDRVYTREFVKAGITYKQWEVIGVVQLDYLELYRKFSFSMEESYKLDHIAHVVLGERKMDYSEYDGLFGLYKENYQKFMEYNIKDVQLVDRLDKKLGFIDQVLAIAYDAKVNYIDTFTTVGMWDTIIHNYLIDKKIVVPPVKANTKTRTIAGGHVKDPQVGMHKWIVSFDLNSLYPHLIMQYNISPESFIDQLEDFSSICSGQYDWSSGKYVVEPDPERCVDMMLDGYLTDEKRQVLQEQNIAVAASGCLFNKDERGFLPTLMQRIYDERKLYKKKMLETKQQLELINEEIKRRGL